MIELLVDPNHKEERFTNAVVRKVLLEVGKNFKLGNPTLIYKYVIVGTDFSRFFVEERSGKVYSAAESLAKLPERVFTFDGTRTLKVGHFKDCLMQASTSGD